VIAWDDNDEYGNRDGSLVEFELEMTELEYAEGDKLKDELHDLLLFDKEDRGAVAKREAERFFGGRLDGGGGGGRGVRSGGGQRRQEDQEGGRRIPPPWDFWVYLR